MTEHEKLNTINNLIGHKTLMIHYRWNGFWHNNYYDSNWIKVIVNVREIIFTPEFIVILNNYLDNSLISLWDDVIDIMNHLDDPVSYIYNLLNLWQQ